MTEGLVLSVGMAALLVVVSCTASVYALMLVANGKVAIKGDRTDDPVVAVGLAVSVKKDAVVVLAADVSIDVCGKTSEVAAIVAVVVGCGNANEKEYVYYTPMVVEGHFVSSLE